MLNDYEALALKYKNTDAKPDKYFSILPTVVNALGDLSGKTVLDLGCGSGFFSREFASLDAKSVIGLDNSEVQIAEAQKTASNREDYRVSDVFDEELPKADIINAPFLLNYLSTVDELVILLKKVFGALNEGGRAFFVIDLPSDKDLKMYGATKTIRGEKKDGAPMTIALYDTKGDTICELNAYYISPETFETALKEAGFESIKRVKPIVSSEGIKKFGQAYWHEYLKDTQLGYYLCS